MTILKREGAPPGFGRAPENHSSLAATEYDNTEYNLDAGKFQHRRSLVRDQRACRLLQQVYDVGPRAILELIDEASDHDNAMLLLAKYARVADLMKAMGAGDLPAPFVAEVPK